MALTSGTRLGSYEIASAIGAGAMGEVYRARDTKLGRDVALKLLPEAFAQKNDRLVRFEREARLLAALNHPNIAQIYEMTSGRLSGGNPDVVTHALVLELVEGETLRDRIRNPTPHALPLADALGIAKQIASALDAAHEKGIIHRDLKPANIKITSDGIVKVLDFGLGRVTRPTDDSMSDQDPTVTSDGTVPGMVLGTAAYMSPEQARGGSVDKRTDIWAFGCVLFEMLTGTRTFGGPTISDTIAEVIGRDPDWARLPAGTPPTVQRLLRHCLQKDVRRRQRDIGDARLDLDDADAAGEPPAGRAAPAPVCEVRLERLTDSVGVVGSPAISPDGKMAAFVVATGGRRQIWVRLLAGGVPLQITRDNVDHREPRWLPDSSALLYFSPAADSPTGQLWLVSALGGPPRRVTTALGGADISRDGRRLALFQRAGDEVALVTTAVNGSSPTIVRTFPPDGRYGCPRWSPDGTRIAFERAGVLFDANLDVVTVATGEQTTLARAGWMHGHAWLPDGSGIVYSASTGSTMAYPPTNNLRVAMANGASDRVLTFGDISYLEPDIGVSGQLLAGRVRSRSDVWKFPIDGAPADNVRRAVRLTRQTGQIQVPSISPDGRQMVFISDSGGHSNLWVADADGSSPVQITFEREPGVTVAVPAWSPASDRLLFVRGHSARLDVCLVDPDGSAFTTLVSHAFAPGWCHDGRSVYYCRSGGRIERLDVATGDTTLVRDDGATGPTAAPDGRTLYFTRLPEMPVNVGGDQELCRARPDNGPADVLAHVAGSRVPLAPRLQAHLSLSPDGRWLATPLIDSTTANIWLVPTAGGEMRPATDFGERSVFIVRWVSWSPDSAHVYAAVADSDADIVLLDGLLG
jgi:eukaryotic-like serine/threonine-protein kinase